MKKKQDLQEFNNFNKPTDKELEESFQQLQPFFKKVDENWKRFLELKRKGHFNETR